MNTTQEHTIRRRIRVRARISGTKVRPRLSVRISNRHIIAQLIDDTKSVTLGYVTTVGAKQTGTMSEQAKWVGEQIAAAAAKHKIKTVVMDRGSKLYHGRIHELATAARAKGLEF